MSPRHQLEIPITNETVKSSDVIYRDTSHMLKEESHYQETTKYKNNDNDDDKKNILSDSTEEEDDIDREIENEINAMNTTLSPKEMNRIKALNEATIVDSSLQVTVDWSDISHVKEKNTNPVVSKKGVLKLKPFINKGHAGENDVANQNLTSAIDSQQQQESWNYGEENWDNDGWSSMDTSSTPEVKTFSSDSKSKSILGDVSSEIDNREKYFTVTPTSGNNQYGNGGREKGGGSKSKASTKMQGQKLQRINSDLGSEFDIKSINIKKKQSSASDNTSSLDFFADMEPVIKTSSLMDQAGAKAKEVQSTSALSFDMVKDATSEVNFTGIHVQFMDQ